MRNQRDNSWILFKNRSKNSERHADYSGEITVNGEVFWMNGWIKDGHNGKFMGGTIRPKEVKLKVVNGPEKQALDDEIPF